MGTYKFSCTGCGRCCYGSPNHYIEATAEEQRRIQEFLGLSPAWFRRRYVVNVEMDLEGLRIERSGRCAFLGDDERCRIYSVRPAQCRHYPFWPELVHDHKAWQAETRRCEGIGRGETIPIARIKAALKRQRAG